MKIEKVSVFENYGPLKKGSMYGLVNRSKDYCAVKCRGTNMLVPINIVNFYPQTPNKKRLDEVEEDLLDYIDEYLEDIKK